ncbi:Raf-like protein serine/threonine-protein kinase phl [Armadillidium nasatum]|uniref:Raf-like protein serine/threonine-protein kinase phl n=1 Tax=Armadillidium nasatum TaxID=96803 RepID=A0A5N5SU35_9CRUS|nr:Raf-like protein serine/threonine-protein kinase phl [Armadillidium nasatum]
MAEVASQPDDKFDNNHRNLNGKSDSFDRNASEAELSNIRNLIQLTKEYIDDLNSRFAGFQHPPSLYLKEYTELTGKLHSFELKEQEILDLLSSKGNVYQNNENYYTEGGAATPHPHTPNMLSSSSGSYGEDTGQEYHSSFPMQNTTTNGVANPCYGTFGVSSQDESTRSTPQSPLRLLASSYQNQAGILATSSLLYDSGPSNSSQYSVRPPNYNNSQYHPSYQLIGGVTSSSSIVVPPSNTVIGSRNTPTPLAPRDRSSSAPNVCCNLVNPSNPLEAASIAELANRIVGKGFNPTSPVYIC